MLDNRSIFLVRKRIFPLTVRTPVDEAGCPRSGSGVRAAAVDSRGARTAMVVERREAQRARSRRFAQADPLWRAPRPKRGRVATSVRVAWPTTRRLPALHSFWEWLS
jgi:hypothetical protein